MIRSMRSIRSLITRSPLLPFALVLGLLAPASSAWAQAAPEGNAHPAEQLVEEAAADLPNPFGEPSSGHHHDHDHSDPYVHAKEKIAFARQVDVGPLRDLAVFHNTRVKIVDTLARETVATLTGKKRFVEEFRDAEGEVTEYAFDPVFTMFDLVIDPGHYADRPILHVGYLPLRKEFVERFFPMPRDASEEVAAEVEERRRSYLKLTRITPVMFNAEIEGIVADYDTNEPYRDGIGRLGRAVQLWNSSRANLLMIAPESTSDHWHHLAESYPKAAEAQRIARELGAAWRAQRVEDTNRLIGELAAVLPTINPELYPTTKRSLELAYNRSAPFTWGYWSYLLALVTLLIAFGTHRRGILRTGMVFLFVAIGLHAFGFIARCLIAERFAIQNQFESMTGVSLFASLVAVFLMAWKRQPLFGAAAAATGFLVLITATETGIPGVEVQREAAILNTSVLLKYHVTIVLTSYGLIALGFILSLFYLVTHYASKLGAKRLEAAGLTPALAVATGAVEPTSRGGATGGDADAAEGAKGAKSPPTQRTLRDLDTATMIVLQLAFWTLGVGILLGAWWADHSWGRWWAFDPKETWALVTWIIYLIVIHTRFTAKNRGLVTAWLSVVGFVVMLWTYFGVNLLLPGLHAYA